jgi:hypothetical protein
VYKGRWETHGRKACMIAIGVKAHVWSLSFGFNCPVTRDNDIPHTVFYSRRGMFECSNGNEFLFLHHFGFVLIHVLWRACCSYPSLLIHCHRKEFGS